jgi:hypothetical protein
MKGTLYIPKLTLKDDIAVLNEQRLKVLTDSDTSVTIEAIETVVEAVMKKVGDRYREVNRDMLAEPSANDRFGFELQYVIDGIVKDVFLLVTRQLSGSDINWGSFERSFANRLELCLIDSGFYGDQEPTVINEE